MAGASIRGGLLRLAAAATARAGASASRAGGAAPSTTAAASHRGFSAAAAAAGLRRASGGGGRDGGGGGGGGSSIGRHLAAGGSSRRSAGRWVTAAGAVPVTASGRLVTSWGPLLGVRRGLATSLPAAASTSASLSASVVAAAVEEGRGVLGRAVAAGPAADVGDLAGRPPSPLSPPSPPPPPPPLPPVSADGGGFGGDTAGGHPPVGEAAWLPSTIPDSDAAAAAAAATAAAGAPPRVSTTLPAGTDVATPAAAVTDMVDAAAPAAADAVAATSPGVIDYLLLPIKATLETVHIMTGLPWWATIALTTLAFRTLILPVSLRVNRRAHRARLLQPRIKELQAAVLQAAESGDRAAQATRQAAMMAFMNKYGVSPVGTLKDMAVQMPIFLGFFATINRMVATDTPGLSTEGALWFVDLTVRDAFYGLPILTGLTTAVMVSAGGDGSNAMGPTARKGMMAIGLLIVPLSAYFPAALFCYWLPSNLVSLAVAMALKWPAVRTAAGFDLPPEAVAASGGVGGQSAGGGRGAVPMSPVEAAASYLRRKGGGEAMLTPGRPVVLLKAPPAKGRRRHPPRGEGGDAPARRS